MSQVKKKWGSILLLSVAIILVSGCIGQNAGIDATKIAKTFDNCAVLYDTEGWGNANLAYLQENAEKLGKENIDAADMMKAAATAGRGPELAGDAGKLMATGVVLYKAMQPTAVKAQIGNAQGFCSDKFIDGKNLAQFCAAAKQNPPTPGDLLKANKLAACYADVLTDSGLKQLTQGYSDWFAVLALEEQAKLGPTGAVIDETDLKTYKPWAATVTQTQAVTPVATTPVVATVTTPTPSLTTPTLTTKKVLFDEGHGPTFTIGMNIPIDGPDDLGKGGYSSFAQALSNSGYTVNSIGHSTGLWESLQKIEITETLLNDVNVLVIPHSSNVRRPDRADLGYSSSELSAIDAFVQNGGGLIIVSDDDSGYEENTIINSLTSHFGASTVGDIYWTGSSLNAYSPLPKSVYSYSTDYVGKLTYGTGWVPILKMGDNVVGATRSFGKGRIAIIADDEFAYNSYFATNKVLVLDLVSLVMAVVGTVETPTVVPTPTSTATTVAGQTLSPADFLTNPDFDSNLNGWSTNYIENLGTNSIQYSTEYGGSAKIYISGSPGAADIEQQITRPIRKGETVVVKLYQTDTQNFGGWYVQLYTGNFLGVDHAVKHTNNEYAAGVTGAEYTPYIGEFISLGSYAQYGRGQGYKTVSWTADRDYPTGTWFVFGTSVWPGSGTFWLMGVYVKG